MIEGDRQSCESLILKEALPQDTVCLHIEYGHCCVKVQGLENNSHRHIAQSSREHRAADLVSLTKTHGSMGPA